MFDCTFIDKNGEEQRRRDNIAKVDDEIKALKKSDNINQNALAALVKRRNILKTNRVEENRFLGLDDGGSDMFDYGRPILKEPMEETLKLPYVRYELLKNEPITKLRIKDGWLVHGEPSGAILKCLPLIQVKRDENNPDALPVIEIPEEDKAIFKYNQTDLDPSFPFDIFNENILKVFQKLLKTKVRLYFLRATNLSAQANETDVNAMLAGMTALSSAIPYPAAIIGEGMLSGDQIKEVKADEFDKVTLNPSFFKNYEMDADLPHDVRLQLRIFNKGSIFGDSLIGSADIDLEDRYYGHMDLRQLTAYEVEKDRLQAELNKIRSAEGMDDKKKEFTTRISNLAHLINVAKIDKVPVEYKAIRLPGKFTSQGSVECIVEILKASYNEKLPRSKIEPPKPQEFEIRLIIWETFEVPRIGQSAVDIFVRVTYAPEGWASEEISKQTDTHMGSDDGWGIFNWRMKFALKLPCNFPRLRFSVFESHAATADVSLGEGIISLKK
eukprot:TRINITY_DN1307_c0_g1_i2.p1 TRINITY_DN1307_c0_g1~~TRINITY_DN1307_c0_g1_i2.p1  ORF type:complete len:498 (-),score=69.53 TRINITY_DN1307_c0_g1_i2:413-1906(-)